MFLPRETPQGLRLNEIWGFGLSMGRWEGQGCKRQGRRKTGSQDHNEGRSAVIVSWIRPWPSKQRISVPARNEVRLEASPMNVDAGIRNLLRASLVQQSVVTSEYWGVCARLLDPRRGGLYRLLTTQDVSMVSALRTVKLHPTPP